MLLMTRLWRAVSDSQPRSCASSRRVTMSASCASSAGWNSGAATRPSDTDCRHAWSPPTARLLTDLPSATERPNPLVITSWTALASAHTRRSGTMLARGSSAPPPVRRTTAGASVQAARGNCRSLAIVGWSDSLVRCSLTRSHASTGDAVVRSALTRMSDARLHAFGERRSAPPRGGRHRSTASFLQPRVCEREPVRRDGHCLRC